MRDALVLGTLVVVVVVEVIVVVLIHFFLITSPMKMEETECSETSTHKI